MNKIIKKIAPWMLSGMMFFSLGNSKTFSQNLKNVINKDSIILSGIEQGKYYNEETKPDSIDYKVLDTNFSSGYVECFEKRWNYQDFAFSDLDRFYSKNINDSGKIDFNQMIPFPEASYLLKFSVISNQGDTTTKEIGWVYDEIKPRLSKKRLPVNDTTYSTKDISFSVNWQEPFPYLNSENSCVLIQSTNNEKRNSLEEGLDVEFEQGLNRVLIRIIDKSGNEVWEDRIFSIDTTLGIKKNQKDNFIVYPNPCENNINLKYNSTNSKDVLVNLYNSQGRKLENFIFESGIQNKKIDMSDYSSGMYLLEYKNKEKSKIEKIIKK